MTQHRPKLLNVAIALVVGLLAISAVQVPADAASSTTKRSLSITATPTAAVVRNAVSLTGILTKSPTGSSVTIQRLSGKNWIAVKTGKTGASTGRYTVRVALPAKAGSYSFRAVAAAKGRLAAATSRTIKVSALTPVAATIKAAPANLTAGASANLSGTVKPFVKNTVVSIQKYAHNTWVSIGVTAVVSATGTFSKAVQVKNGTVFRVSVPRAGLRAPAVSLGTAVVANPAISSTSLPTGSQGAAYSAQLTQVGSNAGTWGVTPALPTGLGLDTGTGIITGTPTGPSSASFQFSFAQPGLVTAVKALQLTITAPVPPTIFTTSLPNGQKGASYTTTLVAQDAPAGTWTAAPLPAGLSLAASTGVISGTPTAAGSTAVVIGFIQTSTGLAAIPKTLNLVVNPPPGPSIRTTSLPNAIQNTPYHATLEASPGSAGTWSVNGGNLLLPLGIVLDQNTGVLGGSSVAVGNYTETFVFTPTDTSIAPVSAKLNLRVVAFAANQFDAIVSAGGSSTCRIGQDQALSCWGYNDAGQLGTGGAQQIDPPGVLKPVRVGSATDWTAISVSGNPLPTEGHACGLRGTTAYCWGSDLHNMLGSNSVTGSETSPVLVPGSLAWQSISAGWTNSCGVTTGGKLYCWGDNSFSQLGTSAGDKAAPTQVGTDTDWESVSTGYTSTCAVKASGSLYCWGANSRGQLGVGSTDSQPTPAQAGTASWTSVAVGDGYACGRQVDGTIYCWGPSSHGQLGNGVSTNSSLTDVTSPLKVGAATDWVSLTTGGGQTCAVNLAGELWCWGSNSDYQVGDATTTDRTVPTRIGTGTSWHSVTAGNLHTCAAQTTGDVYCWGSNNKGRAGINSGVVVDVQTPTMVVG